MPDLQYLLLLVPALLLSSWAAWRVKTLIAEGHQIPARCGLTGAEAAERVLKQAGVIANIAEAEGKLTDHYDPRDKTLRLSSDIYSSKSLSAIGVAAHEAGHAIQDGLGNNMLALRNLTVPLAAFGSNTGMLIIAAGVALAASESTLGRWVIIAGITAFSLTVLFQLINLPVEFDATRRGRENLIQAGLVGEDEDKVIGKVLEAAAMTYVAATLTSIGQIVFLVGKLLKQKPGGRRTTTRSRRRAK
jgi:uncharacterized protein